MLNILNAVKFRSTNEKKIRLWGHRIHELKIQDKTNKGPVGVQFSSILTRSGGVRESRLMISQNKFNKVIKSKSNFSSICTSQYCAYRNTYEEPWQIFEE